MTSELCATGTLGVKAKVLSKIHIAQIGQSSIKSYLTKYVNHAKVENLHFMITAPWETSPK